MRLVDKEESRVIREAVQAHLTFSATGCRFAHAVAKSTRGTHWVTLGGKPDSELIEQLDGVLDHAASVQELAIMIFPDLRRAIEVVAMLEALCAPNTRWSMQLRRWRKHARPDDALVLLQWLTPTREATSVLGMAPFGSMPVTRRAPFVSMAVWPGIRMNGLRSKPDPFVGVGDMKRPRGTVAEEVYKRLFAETRDRVTAMKARPPEGAASNDVTFCLEGDAAARLTAVLPAPE